jgi:hypothetical protein
MNGPSQSDYEPGRISRRDFVRSGSAAATGRRPCTRGTPSWPSPTFVRVWVGGSAPLQHWDPQLPLAVTQLKPIQLSSRRYPTRRHVAHLQEGP